MTGSIEAVALATAAFLVSHVGLSAPGIRAGLVDRLGKRGFLAGYSALSLVLFIWLIAAYAAAPYVELWAMPDWSRHFAMGVMALAVLLHVLGLTQSNPTSVGQDVARDGRDPAPGVLKITRHPVMWSFALWAVAHLPANGDAATVLLAAGIGALALGGTVSLDIKKRAQWGDAWAPFAARTSNIPLAAVIAGRTPLPKFGEIGLWRLGLAALVYLALLVLHPLVIGVPVLAG